MQQSHTFTSPTSQHTSQSLQKSEPAQPDSTASQRTAKPRQKEGQLVTAPTQKAGFRVPKTVLWLIKH
jgi:hypothetical protein